MTIETDGGSESYLTTDQAVEKLLSRSAEAAPAPEPEAALEPVEAEPSEHIESEAEPQAEEASSEPTEANATDETGDPEPAEPAIEAPHWWAAEAKAKFVGLPPELQSVILEQEKNRERGVTQTQQRAAEAARLAEDAAKASQAKATESQALIERLGTLLPKAEEVFKGKWDGATPDWWATLARDDPTNYVRYRAEFDADTALLQQTRTAKQEADEKARIDREKAQADEKLAWANKQAETLRTLVPDLADPQKAHELSKRIVEYAKSLGATDADIANAGAVQWKMAHDAMLAHEARSKLAAPKPKPVVPARPPAKPGAASTRTPQTIVDTAKASLAKTGKPEDAVALLMARAQQRK